MPNTAWNREAIEAWVRRTRFRLPQWGTWLIGHEPNVPDPGVFERAELKVLILRLSPYHEVATSMTHGLLGHISSEVSGVYVDYGFMPPPPAAKEMLRECLPPLFGTTSKRPFTDFDLIALSNSVSNELVNLPWLLQHSGIPLDSRNRLAQEGIPILIMGGANAQSAFIACPPEGDHQYSLVDALFFGEAEARWAEILDFLKRGKGDSLTKGEILAEAAARFPCLHIPQGGGIGRRRAFCADLLQVRSLVKGPVWYDDKSIGYGSVAIDAGCQYLCAFCKEAWESRPYRIRPIENILCDIEEAKRYQGLHRVNLFSFNLTSHPQAARIIKEALALVAHVSMKSQRLDLLMKHPEILLRQQEAGKTNFTFSLEGISGRIREFLGKSIEERQCIEALRMVLSGAVRQIKLFLILTGHEIAGDWDEFEELLDKVTVLRRSYPGSGKAPFILSVTPLISMPHTPMQFNPFPGEGHIRKGIQRLKDMGKGKGMLVRESATMEEARLAQLLLFAGGGQTKALIDAVNAATTLPATSAFLPLFEGRLDPEWVRRAYGEKTPADPFPWDIMYTQDEKERLYRLYERSKKALSKERKAEKEPCVLPQGMMRSGKKGPPVPTYTYWFSLEIEAQMAGVPVPFFQAALARSLSLADQDLGRAYWCPGTFIPDLERIPAGGSRILSLQFRKEVKGLLDRAIQLMEPPWGWCLKGFTDDPVRGTADGALLQIRDDEGIIRERLKGFPPLLTSLSIRNRVIKKGDPWATIIDRASVNKSGLFFMHADPERKIIRLAVKLDGNYAGTFLKAGLFRIWEEGGNPFMVVAWWRKGPASRCPVCKGPLWVSAYDESELEGNPCPSLCALSR